VKLLVAVGARLAEECEYARSLKPKPTTKRKPANQSTTAGRVRRAT